MPPVDRPRIYLDNAATSWPKPESVYRAVDAYMRDNGAAAGRGVYVEAATASAIVADARRRVARLIGAADPKQVVFTLNGTDALSTALHGLLGRAGGHVVTTVLEHNSVLRPLRLLEKRGRISLSIVNLEESGAIDPAAVVKAITTETRLVAITHASNVTGVVLPVAEIAAQAHERGALVLIDAAQTLGHVPVDVRAMGADLLAAPGHKGLLGPLGTGLLYLAPGVEDRVDSLRQGGTGTQSELDEQPAELPEKYEAGNINVAGLSGLAAGVTEVEARAVAAIYAHEAALAGRLVEGLRAIGGVRVLTPAEECPRVGVVSFQVAGYEPGEVAAALDSGPRIQVRSGLHCAPHAHRALGTIAGGGTVRASIGPFNTPEHVERLIAAVAEIAAATIIN